eukprot:scaffold670727_cov60-Prasinocladus_malaysianus.AAC.1
MTCRSAPHPDRSRAAERRTKAEPRRPYRTSLRGTSPAPISYEYNVHRVWCQTGRVYNHNKPAPWY